MNIPRFACTDTQNSIKSTPEVQAAIFQGQIFHQRSFPTTHAFNYRIFYFYFDVDNPGQLSEASGLIGNRPWHPFSFRDSDYLNANSSTNSNKNNDDTLGNRVRNYLLKKSGQPFTGKIMILTQLRVFGYCFNPVSFYYCFNSQNQLQYILADINNTPWDEKFCYFLKCDTANTTGSMEFDFKKQFHVSPFNPMDMQYQWHFNSPRESLNVTMNNVVINNRHFSARLNLIRQPLNATTVCKVCMKFPFMTLKIISAIYWNALLLWLKRTPTYTNPSISSTDTVKKEATHGDPINQLSSNYQGTE